RATDEPGARAIWIEVRDTLRRRLGDVKFDAWIAPLELIAEVNGEILLAAANEHERGRVDTAFGHHIQSAWGQADSAGRRTRIAPREKIARESLALAWLVEEEMAEDEILETEELSGDVPVTADGDSEEVQTLENFLVGDSNRLAYGLA